MKFLDAPDEQKEKVPYWDRTTAQKWTRVLIQGQQIFPGLFVLAKENRFTSFGHSDSPKT